MMWTTPKANVPSTTPPSYHGPPADGRDEIMHQPDYSNQPVKQEETENSKPMEFKKHRNRHLINSKVCGMTCEIQQTCKKLEKVSSFLKKPKLILTLTRYKSNHLIYLISYTKHSIFSISSLEYLVVKYPHLACFLGRFLWEKLLMEKLENRIVVAA